MGSSTLDKDRLGKLLALAESDQDGEALAALRKATRLLRADGQRLRDLQPPGAGPPDTPSRDALRQAKARLGALTRALEAARALKAQAELARDHEARQAADLRAQRDRLQVALRQATEDRDNAVKETLRVLGGTVRVEGPDGPGVVGARVYRDRAPRPTEGEGRVARASSPRPSRRGGRDFAV